jgi:hypothetical protein
MIPGPATIPLVVAAAVAHGWSVMPVNLTKHPLVTEWKSLQAIRPSIDQVERWNKDLRPAAWAVVTGEISGLVVLDFDGPSGLETMKRYGVSPHVQSGSGGAHGYFQHPGFRVPTINGKSKPGLDQMLPGTDVKGDGGYVIFHGRNERGRYRRLRPLVQLDAWNGELIDRLMSFLREDEIKPDVREPILGTGLIESGGRAPAEEILATFLARERNGAARNNTGLALACQLRDNNYSEDEAVVVMLQYAASVKSTNSQGIREPYTDSEALATLKSAYARPPREPWAKPITPVLASPSAKTAKNAEQKSPLIRAGRVITSSFADVEAKPINWLWPMRIARGKVNLIAGNPGLGKSQITASIAAVVTTGGYWPVDRGQAMIGNVIFLSAEDDPADTMRPRLEAAGTILRRVHFVKSVLAGLTSEGKEVHRAFCLKHDLDALARAIEEIGDVSAVVLDPITAYLGDTDSHRNAEVRALLAPLSELAAKSEAAVIGVSHLNKTAGTDALLRVMGSLAFVAAARTAHLIADDPEVRGRRLFLPLKNNLAADIGGLAFRIEATSIETPNGPIETSRVMWEQAPVTLSADEAIRPRSPEDGSALGEACDWLRQLLENPTPAAEVCRQARGVGIRAKTLRRAAEKLGVRRQKTGMETGWTWSMPTQPRRCPELPKIPEDAEDAHQKEMGTFDAEGADGVADRVVDIDHWR